MILTQQTQETPGLVELGINLSGKRNRQVREAQALVQKEYALALSTLLAKERALVEKNQEVAQVTRDTKLGPFVHQVLGLKAYELVTYNQDDAGRHYIDAYTVPLYVKDDRTNAIHLLGPFKVSVVYEKNGSDPRFLFLNQWFRVLAYNEKPCNHPHVWGDGTQCLGSAKDDFTQALAGGDLFSFFATALAFLTSVNTADGAGKLVNRWPVVKPGQKPSIQSNLLVIPASLYTEVTEDKKRYGFGIAEDCQDPEAEWKKRLAEHITLL